MDSKVALSEYPTNTLKKVYVNVDSKGKKYVENTITTIKIDIFEREKQKQTPCRQLTQTVKYQSNFKLSHDASKGKIVTKKDAKSSGVKEYNSFFKQQDWLTIRRSTAQEDR